MHSDHKVLFPAFLILFAMFLSFNYDTLVSSDVEIGNSLTGYSVIGGVCGDSGVMSMYKDTNSHVASAGTDLSYCAAVPQSLLTSNPLRNCYADLSNLIGYASSGNDIGAEFSSPKGVHVLMDVNGFSYAYVADTGNHCLRIAKGDGGVEHFSGQCESSGNQPGNANAAKFDSPEDLTEMGGNFYVADTGNHCIRQVNVTTGTVSTFAGSCGGSGTSDGLGTNAKFNSPSGITSDGVYRLWVSDDKCVREIDTTNANVTTLVGTCGGGGSLGEVNDIVYNSDLNEIYIADKENSKIRNYSLSSSSMSDVINVVNPIGIVLSLDKSHLYVSTQHKINKVGLNPPILEDYAGGGFSGFVDGTLTASRFDGPNGIGIDSFGNLFVADTNNHAMRVLSSGSPINVYTLSGKDVVGKSDLSPVTNAHYYSPVATTNVTKQGTYARICYDGLSCETKNAICQSPLENIFTFSSDTNAMVGNTGDYGNYLCCEDGGSGIYCGDGVINGGETCESNADCSGSQTCVSCQCTVPGDDADGDGIINENDNCPNHPNSATLGTCVVVGTLSNPDPSDTGITTCTTDDDCNGKTLGGVATTYCAGGSGRSQKNNDNPSGNNADACGDACDIDSRNACTCSGENLCPGVDTCSDALVGATFGWNMLTANKGELTNITLDLNFMPDCDGETFDITVIDADTSSNSRVTPAPITVTNAKGSTEWYAENNNPGETPANITWYGETSKEGMLMKTGNLNVSAGTSYCGDGEINGGEQCDFSANPQFGDGSDSCEDFGLTGGASLDCNDCVINTTSCTGTSGSCGDGNINPGETCDGTNMSGLICTDIDEFTGGSLGCYASGDANECTLNVSDCVGSSGGYCGDGIQNIDEACDDGGRCEATSDYCTSDSECTANVLCLPQSGDGCDDTCDLEDGYGGGGSGNCNSNCIKGNTMCSTTGTTLYTCAEYDNPPDGCYEWGFGESCTDGETCSPEFNECVASDCSVKNNPTIMVPSCSNGDEDYVCGKWGDCTDGEKTRTCSKCDSETTCPLPTTTINCEPEPSVKGSAFDLFSWMVGLFLIAGFYLVREKKLKISFN